MRIVAISYFALSAALLSPAGAAPFRLCKDQVAQDRGLYVQVFLGHSLGCWAQVQNSFPVSEGNRAASNLPTLPPKNRQANFAYLLQQPEDAHTVVVIKERVMTLQLDNFSGKYVPQPASDPPGDVALVRPPVLSNRCGDRAQHYGPVPGTRTGLMNIGDYNRYHEQGLTFGFIPNAIPRSDQLHDFHFRYPVTTPNNKPSCRDTDDFATGNRREYAFKNLSSLPPASIVEAIAHAIIPVQPAYAANTYYSKLKAHNIHVSPSSTTDIPTGDEGTARYFVVRFAADADAYTRTELTISNLQDYRDGSHSPLTWQVDWLNVKETR